MSKLAEKMKSLATKGFYEKKISDLHDHNSHRKMVGIHKDLKNTTSNKHEKLFHASMQQHHMVGADKIRASHKPSR